MAFDDQRRRRSLLFLFVLTDWSSWWDINWSEFADMARCVSVVVVLLVCACAAPDNSPAPDESATAGSDSVVYTVADFLALSFLEGDWRGSGYEGGAFYESYRVVNDSTIEMTEWADSTMTTAREKSEYVLRGGRIGTSKGARLVRVDADGHHFQASSYGWAFRQVSPDQWTARVGPATTYTMDRIRR